MSRPADNIRSLRWRRPTSGRYESPAGAVEREGDPRRGVTWWAQLPGSDTWEGPFERLLDAKGWLLAIVEGVFV